MANLYFGTTNEQTSGLFALTLGAAPGATYLAQTAVLTPVATATALINATGASTIAGLATIIQANLGIPATDTAATATITAYLGNNVATAGQGLINFLAAAVKVANPSNSLYGTYGIYADKLIGTLQTGLAYSLVATNNSTNVATLQAAVANANTVVTVGSTFDLTNAANQFTGTALADTFNALYSSTTGMTFGTNDVLNGGEGIDTLYLQVGTTGSTGPAATLKDIEILSTNFAAAGTVNLLGATGVTTIESNGSSAVAAFSNIGSTSTALKLTNTTLDTTFAYTTAAVNGSADAASLTLNNVTAGTVTLAGVETVNITSSGSANALTVAAADATTINILGDQALNLGTLSSLVTTLNAAGNTASGTGVTATLAAVATATITGSTGKDNITVSAVTGNVTIAAGAGDDTITATAGLTNTDVIGGGEGTADLLVTTAALAEAYTAPTTRTITGFEQLKLSTAGSAATTLTTANLDTAIATVTLNAGTAGAYGITGPAGTLAVKTVTALAGALTLTDTGTATTDAATLTNSSILNANVFAGQAVTSTGYETLNINAGTAVAANLAAQVLGAITVTADTGGASAVNFTGANAVSTGVITAATVNAAALTGTFTQTAAAATATATITGSATAANTIIGALATAGTLTGGSAADVITGGNLADTIIGGAGNDTITGGVGKDSLTGGAGVDTFVFAANATGAVVSNLAAPDVITDFVSGTDKLSITNITTGAPTKFLGTFSSLTSANAAALQDGTAGHAFFVSGDNNLYVEAIAGTQAINDTVINLASVTTLTAADLLLGTQGTGNTITLTAVAANLTTAISTNASAVTTAFDDAISSTAAFLVNSTVTVGAGNDTLTISTAPTTAVLTTLAAAGGTGALVSSIENIIFTLGTTNAIAMPATTGLTVTNASSTAAASVTLGAATGQTYTASGSGINTVVVNGANASVTGGTGSDAFGIATTVSALGSTFVGGTGGTDVLTLADASLTLAFSSSTASSVLTSITGIETLTLGGAINTLSITNDQAITINGGTGVTTVAGTAGTGTITVVGAAATALNVSGTSNFAVSGSTTGVVTSTQTAGTLVVTGAAGVSASVVSSVATTYDATLNAGTLSLGGVGDYTVTGAGTAAIGVITEAATHTTGALTITTAGANTVATITENAAGTGAVTINVGGTAAVTITALTTHASHTFNLSNTATTTVLAASTSTAYTINTTSATAHTYVNSSTTSSVDTYVGSSSVDNVTLGLGADKFTTGGGADVFTLAPTTDTGLVLGYAASSATATVNSFAINTSGLDVITGFSAGATIVTAVTYAAVTATELVRNGGTSASAAATDPGTANALLVGTYSSGTNTFTVSTSGSDSLFVYDDNGTTLNGSYRGIVLVGYVDAAGNDTMSPAGIFTSVAG